MADMRTELDAQKATLENLLGEIEEKKPTAEKYAQLAETNQGAVSVVGSSRPNFFGRSRIKAASRQGSADRLSLIDR